MATYSNSTVINHSTDAGYRAWIIDFHTIISGAGLVQTADTGQVNTSTITRPAGSDTSNCYSIWKLPDSSLYFKISFGNGQFNTVPQFFIQTGEGSDGAGNLTGQTSTNISCGNRESLASTSTPYTSYCCVTNDYFGIVWKVNATTSSYAKAIAAIVVCKTVDNTGTATNIGYIQARLSNTVPFSSTSPVFQSVRRIATAATYAQTSAFCIIPGATASTPTTSLDSSGNIQVWTSWGNFPHSLPIMHLCTYKQADITTLTTFSVAMVGTTSHTYMALGLHGSPRAESVVVNTNFAFAILYE